MMMNTRKILMIIGGLLLGAVGTSYLMLLQADRRATAEATAGMEESTQAPVVDPRVSENHVTEGSIGSSQQTGAISKNAAVAQQPVVPAPAPAPAKVVPAPSAPAPQVAEQPKPSQPQVTPQPQAQAEQQLPAQPKPQPQLAQKLQAQPQAQAQQQAQQQVQPKQAPSTAVASVNTSTTKVSPTPRAQRGRDDLQRRAMVTQGSTAETDELVRESAKLDPSLPLPDSSVRAYSNTSPPPAPTRSPDTRASNQSSAALTDRLVRESSRPDPSLPAPDMAAVRAAPEVQRGTITGASSNPVAAAMTEQLVRDSAKLDPSLPPPK
jgi:hypothetical protein